jgi:uncharacterized protein YceK
MRAGDRWVRSATTIGPRLVLPLALLLLGGCGIHRGYLTQSSERIWPDSYYYAALRADARQWQAVDARDTGWAARAAAQGLILADLPASILADTATLPVLLCTAAAQAVLGSDGVSGTDDAPSAPATAGQSEAPAEVATCASCRRPPPFR